MHKTTQNVKISLNLEGKPPDQKGKKKKKKKEKEIEETFNSKKES